jgi:hypothetical protein
MTYGIGNDSETHKVLTKHPIANYIVNSVHGSGINYDWYADETQNNIRLYNKYDLMDEMGYYTHAIDFVVVIPKKNPKEFKIQYPNDFSRYHAKRNAMSEYLYDIFGYEIGEFVRKQPHLRMMKRDDINKCPYCGGFPQYFNSNSLTCRDCGKSLKWDNIKKCWVTPKMRKKIVKKTTKLRKKVR